MKDTTRTSIDIEKELLKDVKIYCAEHDISIKEFVIEAIKEKLEK